MTGAAAPRRTPLAVVLAASVLLSVAACSSSKGPSVTASDAAATVAAIFNLPADQQSCLEQHFSDDSHARAVFVGQGVATTADLDALGQVEEACIPADTLAASVTNGASDAFGGTLTDTQTSCLTNGVKALSDDDRRKLLVGLAVSNSGALDLAGVAELGKVTNGILDLCGLDIATTQTADPSGPTG